MASWEDMLREKLGQPVEQAGQETLQKVDRRLESLRGAPTVGGPARYPGKAEPGLSSEYDKNYEMADELLRRRALAEKMAQETVQPEVIPQPQRFQRLKQALAPEAQPQGAIELSDDPEEMQRQIEAARRGQ